MGSPQGAPRSAAGWVCGAQRTANSRAAAPDRGAESGVKVFDSPVVSVARGAMLASVASAALASPAAASGGSLEILPDLLTLSILLVAFVLLIVPVNRLLIRPLVQVLEAREAQIEGARQRAREIEHEADAILGRYTDSVRAAREAADAERRRLTDAAREKEQAASAESRREADRELGRARGEIADALVEARETLHSRAEELAREAAERILGRALS